MQSFSIDTDIYDRDLISQAIVDFEEFTKFELQNDNTLVVYAESQEKEIYLEFMNYLIGLYNQN